MSGSSGAQFVRLRQQPEGIGAGARPEEPASFEVNVIFTTTEGTVAALKSAEHLARQLSARIRIVAPQVVPLRLPLTHPPVSIEFLEQRLMRVAGVCSDGVEVRAELLLCRERAQCLMQVLRRDALVVLGGKKRRWLAREDKLAAFLRAKGCRVIFITLR